MGGLLLSSEQMGTGVGRQEVPAAVQGKGMKTENQESDSLPRDHRLNGGARPGNSWCRLSDPWAPAND